MLVISMSTEIADSKYVRILHGAMPQFCFNQRVAVTLPTPNTIPIITTGITAAEKIAVRPRIL
jgi:hypothetical protein